MAVEVGPSVADKLLCPVRIPLCLMASLSCCARRASPVGGALSMAGIRTAAVRCSLQAMCLRVENLEQQLERSQGEVLRRLEALAGGLPDREVPQAVPQARQHHHVQSRLEIPAPCMFVSISMWVRIEYQA